MEKEIAVEKVNFDFSKHFSADAEFKKLFKSIGFQGYEIVKNKNIQMSKDKLISIVSIVDSKTGNNKKILIYGISGEATYTQMREIAYEHKHNSDIDARVIIFYHPGEPECEYMNNKQMTKSFINLLNNCQMESYFIEIVATEDTDSNNLFHYSNMMGFYNQTQTNYKELPPQSLFQEVEIWTYFNQYADDTDPAGPFSDWECDDLPGLDPDLWLFVRPNDLGSNCSWDENGMALIKEATSADEKQNLKDFFQDRKTELEETFEGSKIIFHSEPCKLVIMIDERPLSEFIDLPLEQNKRMIEKLADYRMAFYHMFWLTR
ncbi:MAG: hypothetical protein FP812_07320 [Desulfobacula sp.]|nr:hypothetical protein [Desulfobacula sp.]